MGYHKFVGGFAPHCTHIGTDGDDLDAAPVEDVVVGLHHAGVELVEALLGDVHTVGIFHDEFAQAQHAPTRPCLIPKFFADVVDELGQVAVAFDFAACQIYHHLFMGRRHAIFAATTGLNAHHNALHLFPAACDIPNGFGV